MIAEKAQMQTRPAAGSWPWLLQRVSAAFLLFFLGTHIWVLHFALGDEQITFARVAERLKQPFFQVVDMVLLAVVIYHALYGIRSIVLDFKVQGGARQALTWGFVVLGLVGFVYGSITLVTFFKAM